MTTITFNIPDDKFPKIVEALNGLFPVPKNEEGAALFSNNEWAKEVVRRWIVQATARHEQMKAQQAIPFTPDDSIIS